MASGPFLIGASLSRYGARGVAGEPVWRRAQQLRAAIEARLGGRHADLFAIPQVDEFGDKVDWYAPFDGVARGWNDLSGAEQRMLEGKVSELKPELERLVARLDSDGRGEGERAFGRLLREAMVAPGSETLFSVAGRPVFAFWGFTGDAETARYFMGMLPPATSMAVPAAAAPAVAAAAVPPPPPPPAPEPPRESGARQHRAGRRPGMVEVDAGGLVPARRAGRRRLVRAALPAAMGVGRPHRPADAGSSGCGSDRHGGGR